MSNLFGVYKKTGLSDKLRVISTLQRSVMLGLTCKVNCYREEGLHLFQSDYGQYKQTAWTNNESAVATLVGHPVVSADRQDDLNLICAQFPSKQDDIARIEGSCLIANYSKRDKALELITDPLGLRPFYFMEYDGGIVFSSNLNVFEKIGVTLTPNADALCEYSTLGYFLFDNTPYNEVKCARPGQRLLTDQEGKPHCSTYFDWMQLARQNQTVGESICGIDRDFKAVCERYVGKDKNVITTLSGGLDSRLIACELQRRNLKFKAFNFSQEETQDVYCAKTFAHDNNIDVDFIRVSNTQEKSVEQRLNDYWRTPQPDGYNHVERPQLAWSGNGGSVGLGYIYFSEPVYQAALTQDPEKLATAYLAQQYAFLPSSMLENVEDHQAKLKHNIVKSLLEYEGVPLEKAYYLFLLHNDQHHHLSIPCEQVDEHQMEFCVPIYSWRVLRHIVSLPVEESRRHKFYLKWLAYAYPSALKSPWQAYPGHIPCPFKIEANDQWTITHTQKLKLNTIASVWKKVFKKRFKGLIRPFTFSCLCLLHLANIKDATPQLKFMQRMTNW